MEENNYRKSWTRVQESEQPDNMIMAYLLRNKIQLTELKIKKKKLQFYIIIRPPKFDGKDTSESYS